MSRSTLLLLLLFGTFFSLVPASASAIGLLIPNDRGERPFDVESHRVEITVANTAAVTKITQVFRNHTARPLEATFVFPIPAEATVSDFSLWINGKKTAGAVMERDEARRIYESIVRRVEDPGLIEYIDGKIFKASIFPIPAGGTQELEIKFGQVLQKRGGLYRYHYPMRVGQKYAVAKTQRDFTLSAKISAPLGVSTVYSPTHDLDEMRKSPNEVIVGTEALHESLDRDFEMFVGHSKQDIGLHVMTYDPDGSGGEDGYFMMGIAPKVEDAAHQEMGQTFTFVMDTSGSMSGQKIEQARDTLAFCIKRLKPQDHFNIVRFSTDVEKLYDNPISASSSAIQEGLAFSRGLSAAGGTAIAPALEVALGQSVPSHQTHQVIFVTDGMPTIGKTLPRDILNVVKKNAAKKARVFTFGLGFDVNASLLDSIAAESQGRSDYVKPEEALESAVAALYIRISSPVLSDLKITFAKTKVLDMYPHVLPDLFSGDQLVIFGRYRGTFDVPITVAGRTQKGPQVYTYGSESSGTTARTAAPEASYSEPLEFLPKLWATRKVGFLLEQIRFNGENPELKQEVIRLAKRFALVTPYTSYLAVDDEEFERPSPGDVNQGAGDVFGKGFGMDEGGRGGGGASRARSLGGGAKAQAPPHVSRPSKKSRRRPLGPKKSSPMDLGAADLFAEGGEASVRASEYNEGLKEAEAVEDESGSRARWISGRTFELDDKGVWVEQGLKAAAKPRVVKQYSKQYFELVRKHKELQKILTLGSKVRVSVDGRTYEFVP